MNRRWFLNSTIGAVAAASITPKAAAQATRVLRYSDHEPLGGMRTRFLKNVVFPAIEKESSGRLKIEDHWNGEIAAAYDALDAIGSRKITDMASIVPEYTAKDLPLHQIFKSFPTGPTGSKQTEFFRRVYAEIPAFPAELERNNIVQIFFGTGYPVAFFSTAPMAGLDGLKGGKWRSASFWHQDFLRNAGATPVTTHWGPETYDALKAKTVDGLMVNVDSGYMLKVHDVAPHVLISKDLWLGHVYLLSLRKDVWLGLAREDQDAIRRAAGSAYRTLGSVMDSSFDAQVDDLRKAGASVRLLDSDEVGRWKTVTAYQKVQSSWVENQIRTGEDKAGVVLAGMSAIMQGSLETSP